MKPAALKTSIQLSLLFLLVYGGSNWMAAHRGNVGSYYFQWERQIPFVPLMIVPYMSIDLLFVAAPFFARNERQLKTLRNQVIAGILIAGTCFLIFPLRFAFERPPVDGVLGLLFNSFRKLDQPYNQLPSLHIILRTILAVFYVSNLRGVMKWAMRVWFSLIGFSTVLTYQHHVIDVIGGFAVGAMCVYLWQDEPLRQPVRENWRVGTYYAAGAVATAALGILLQPWGFALLWPAMSLGIVAAAYFGLGPGIYRKSNGTLPILTRIVLWPVLLGQRLSWRHYAQQCETISELDDHVWIGRRLTNAEARRAIENGVAAVVDLAGEFSQAEPFRELDYLQLSILDLTAPTADQLERAVEFIRQKRSIGIVYVHCKAGYSRTAAVAGAYLLAEDQTKDIDDAVQILREARPAIVIRPEVKTALEEFSGNRRPTVLV